MVAHSSMGEGHMGSGMTMCVAVLEVGAFAITTALALSEPGWLARPRRGTATSRVAPRLSFPAAPEPRARAGPPLLQVFLL